MPPKGSPSPKLTDDLRIEYRSENPKRPGTKANERYEQYKVAATVGEAINLGACRGDIANDVKQGFCTILNDNGACREPAEPQSQKRPAEQGDKGTAKKPKRSAAVPEAPAKQDEVEHSSLNAEPAANEPAEAPSKAAPDAPEEPKLPSPLAELALQSNILPSAASISIEEPKLPSPLAELPLQSNILPSAASISIEEPKLPSPLAELPLQSNILPSAASMSTSSSCSRPAAKPLQEVDLSFAKLDGKPLKFIKRTMGEAKRLLCDAGLAEAEKSGYKFSLKDKENLSKWLVQLRDLNPDGKLAAALKKHKLEPCVDLELSLPDGFPLEPPFARVVYPQLQGGYVFPHGGICFEALTQKGWVPSMTLPALAIAIKGILDYGEVTVAGIGNKETRTVPQYTEAGARKDHNHISSAHRGGEGNTYGSLKNYAS